MRSRTTRNGIVLSNSECWSAPGGRWGTPSPCVRRSLKTDGSTDWTFKIVGTFDTPLAKKSVVLRRHHTTSISTSIAHENRNTAETFYIRIDDGTKAVATSAAIDRIFANSPNETRTLSHADARRRHRRSRWAT